METSFYEKMMNSLPIGYAYHRIICDDQGNPSDYKFLECNPMFETITGLQCSEIKGKLLTEVIPQITQDDFNWIQAYGEIALNGGAKEFEQFSSALTRFYKVRVYSPEKYFFATFITDITDEKNEALEKVTILNALNDIVFTLDENYTILYILASEDKLLFMPREKILGHKIQDLFQGELKNQLLAVLNLTKQTGKKQFTEYKAPVPSENKWFRAEVSYVVVNNQKKMIVSVMDISEQRLLQNEIIRKTKQIENFFSITLDLLCIADFDGRFIRVNKAWEELTGFTSGELEGTKFLDFVHPEDIETTHAVMKKLSNGERVIRFMNRYRCKDGTYKFIEWSSQAYGDAIYAAARDTTQRIQMEKQLREQKEQFELAIRGSNDGIWDWNLVTNELYLSAKWKQQLGFTDDELPNSLNSFFPRIHPDDLEHINKKVQRYLEGKTSFYDVQFRVLHKDGHYRWIRSRGEALRDENGKAYRMAGSHTDISDQKEAEGEILYLSYHDQLTGLYNRRYYEEALIKLNLESKLPITLIMADVNFLKKTNDTHGHQTGDQLLIAFANILKQECRVDDVVARIGGDEFVVLLPKTDLVSAEKIVERINRGILEYGDEQIQLSVSFGIKTKTLLEEAFSEIYKEAEDDMYRHKFWIHQNEMKKE